MPLIDVNEADTDEGFSYFKGLCLLCFMLILFIYSLPGAIYLIVQPRDFIILHADADSSFVNSEILTNLNGYITSSQRIYFNESEHSISVSDKVKELSTSISCKHLNLIVLTKSLIEVFHPNHIVLNRKEIFTLFWTFLDVLLLLNSDAGNVNVIVVFQ